MKVLATIAGFLFLVSCSLKPIRPTAEINYNQPMTKTTDLLLSQANKCWKRDQKILGGDGIRIDSKKSVENTNVISASRYASDIGLREPSLEVEIKDNGKNSSKVSVKEGDWACNLMGQCKPMGFSQDIEHWLNGNLSCNKLEF